MEPRPLDWMQRSYPVPTLQDTLAALGVELGSAIARVTLSTGDDLKERRSHVNRIVAF